MKILLCFFALYTASLPASAANEKLTCDEYREFAHGMAVVRDMGKKESRAKELIDESADFTSSQKKALKGIIHEIYTSPEMTPALLGEAAKLACVTSARRRAK